MSILTCPNCGNESLGVMEGKCEKCRIEPMKDTNPKDAIGCNKLPFHLCSPTVQAYHAIGQLDGLFKYGRTNWRVAGVKASIYIDACKRHLEAWFEGEENAPDNGVPHLAHALACIGIIVDAKAEGKLVDDRAYSNGGYQKVLAELTPLVKMLREKYKDKNPKHWTIQDRHKVTKKENDK